jgi:SAM-dependent methyltransferase
MWPLPALAAWAGAWLVLAIAGALGAGEAVAFVCATALGAVVSFVPATAWRRVLVGAGFPLSFAATRAASTLPAWAWLVVLVVAASLYPVRAWRDAPLFPTRRNALRGLSSSVPLRPAAEILDAGCGLGAGLIELRREYPGAVLSGIEWSWPLWLACVLRCRFARIRRRDLWSADWSPFALVYLFQRPESMARAAAKATHELRAGAWLASLDFEIAALEPDRCLQGRAGRSVWLYQAPFTQRR